MKKGIHMMFNVYVDDLRDYPIGFVVAEIWVRNDDTQRLHFKVKRKDLLFDNQIGPTYEVGVGKSGSVNVSLDASSNYYIEFQGPCKFSGWIR